MNDFTDIKIMVIIIYFPIANVSLKLDQRNTVRFDIDCPMDTLTYNCSILSNSETAHLTWNVTLPGLMPRSITYDNTSMLNQVDNLSVSVSTVLTRYITDEYIESTLVLTLMRDVNSNETRIDCEIGDLGIMTMVSFVNTSG